MKEISAPGYRTLSNGVNYENQNMVLSKDTKDSLNKIAEQLMWEEKQPERGFEILGD